MEPNLKPAEAIEPRGEILNRMQANIAGPQMDTPGLFKDIYKLDQQGDADNPDVQNLLGLLGKFDPVKNAIVDFLEASVKESDPKAIREYLIVGRRLGMHEDEKNKPMFTLLEAHAANLEANPKQHEDNAPIELRPEDISKQSLLQLREQAANLTENQLAQLPHYKLFSLITSRSLTVDQVSRLPNYPPELMEKADEVDSDQPEQLLLTTVAFFKQFNELALKIDPNSASLPAQIAFAQMEPSLRPGEPPTVPLEKLDEERQLLHKLAGEIYMLHQKFRLPLMEKMEDSLVRDGVIRQYDIPPSEILQILERVPNTFPILAQYARQEQQPRMAPIELPERPVARETPFWEQEFERLTPETAYKQITDFLSTNPEDRIPAEFLIQFSDSLDLEGEESWRTIEQLGHNYDVLRAGEIEGHNFFDYLKGSKGPEVQRISQLMLPHFPQEVQELFTAEHYDYSSHILDRAAGISEEDERRGGFYSKHHRAANYDGQRFSDLQDLLRSGEPVSLEEFQEVFVRYTKETITSSFLNQELKTKKLVALWQDVAKKAGATIGGPNFQIPEGPEITLPEDENSTKTLEEKRAEIVPLLEEDYRLTDQEYWATVENADGRIHSQAVGRVEQENERGIDDFIESIKKSLRQERLFRANPDASVNEIRRQLGITMRDARELRTWFDSRFLRRGEYPPYLAKLLKENAIEVNRRKGELRDQLPALLQGREAARIQITPEQLLKFLESIELPEIEAGDLTHLNPGFRKTKFTWVGDALRITGQIGVVVKEDPRYSFRGEDFSVDLAEGDMGGVIAENASYKTPAISEVADDKKDLLEKEIADNVTSINGVIGNDLQKSFEQQGFKLITLKFVGKKIQLEAKKAE